MSAQLLAIANTPIKTIPDVIASFEAIDALLPDNDGLKWFNWLYLTVTKSVDSNLGTSKWRNPAWLAQLDVIFARLYLDALSKSLTPGGNPPKCWAALFHSRNDVRLARLQFALAGINAHIDHDLSVAVVETCRQFGTSPKHLSPEYLDYTQVNQILQPVIDQVKPKLLTGLLGVDLPSIDLVENLAGSFGLAATREAAWTNSEMLWAAEQIPGLSKRFLTGLDDAATLAARGLLAPVGI